MAQWEAEQSANYNSWIKKQINTLPAGYHGNQRSIDLEMMIILPTKWFSLFVWNYSVGCQLPNASVFRILGFWFIMIREWIDWKLMNLFTNLIFNTITLIYSIFFEFDSSSTLLKMFELICLIKKMKMAWAAPISNQIQFHVSINEKTFSIQRTCFWQCAIIKSFCFF